MGFHDAPLFDREEFIARYLSGRITPESANAFEEHYFDCDECFEELRASAALREALSGPIVRRRHVGDTVVIDFAAAARLVAGSQEYQEFLMRVGASSDSRVLIDLSRVSRIDSAGLGLLMRYYSRVLTNNGKFGVLKPSKNVQKVMDATGVGRLLNISFDENDALEHLDRN